MNVEQLNKANKLLIEIEHTKKMISSLQAPYTNAIRANSYNSGKETTEVHLFESDSKLSKLLINYFNDVLAELQKEFDSL